MGRYLNTVPRGKGGGTFFPKALNATTGEPVSPWRDEYGDCGQGLSAEAVEGDATLFYSMTPDGAVDPLSLHGGCEVEEGEKWGANQWCGHPDEHSLLLCHQSPTSDGGELVLNRAQDLVAAVRGHADGPAKHLSRQHRSCGGGVRAVAKGERPG